MTDEAWGLSVLHVVVRASDTNSQYNEHCLPVRHERRITVCSLFPATVVPPPQLVLIEGDGTVRGCFSALREALGARTYDVVHVHAASSAVLTLLTYARLHRSRQDLVFTLHNSWPNFRRRNRLFLWLVAALFPVVVACGDAAGASLPRVLRRLTRRLEVVPNGVDVDRVDRVLHHHVFGHEGSGAQAGLRVLAVNRLIPIKDPDTVMEAFVRASSPEDTLVMVGEGALAKQLASAVKQSGLEHQIQLTGGLPREDVYEHMQAAAVFVSASAGEGLPVSVLEAMTCRCPVVLSDIPPHREIAMHASTVRLVTPGDVDGFAEEIRRSLRMSAFERYSVGEDLRRVALQHFSVAAMNEGYGRVYRSVADHNKVPVEQRSRFSAQQPQRRARRRMAAWVAAGLLGATAGAWYGAAHPPQYRATTTLGVRTPDASGSESATRSRAAVASGLADLVRRQVVLAPVAKRLSVDDWRVLPSQVRGRVGNEDPIVIQVTASARSAREAERLAGAVADELVALTKVGAPAVGDTGFVDRELTRLEHDIAQTQRQIDTQLSQLGGVSRDVAARQLTGLRAQLTGLQGTYRSMLDWRGQSRAPTGLTVVDQPSADGTAWPPPRAAVAALGAGAALAVMLSLSLLAAATRDSPGRPGTAGGAAVASARGRPDPYVARRSHEPVGLPR